MSLLDASSRIALTALLHDLGKLAERASIDIPLETLENNQQLYCPHPKAFTDAKGQFTHKHAAYTGIAWDILEETQNFPDLRRNSPPFISADNNSTDSAVNAASAHHKPDTFLQWVVATADRVASGFEREAFEAGYNQEYDRPNHVQSRLLTLFEQIGKPPVEEGELKWRYALKPLSPEAIFPQPEKTVTPSDKATAQAQYQALWDTLLTGIKQIPNSHVGNLPLWLDHFDSLWLNITHAIPAASPFGKNLAKPDVSLYDHCKATAALATALWRWHHETGDETVATIKDKSGWEKDKFLLVQGDFYGIQDFIFAEGGDTQKHAHKLLRGRSFQVSLLAECAALKMLEALELPSTSQIINAAGKFLIVAPNTTSAKAAVEKTKAELNQWCLQHTYGEIGVGIATTSASCNDFRGGNFDVLIDRLFKALDVAKHQRFDLCGATPAVFEGYLDSFDNNLGVCGINGKHPANPGASAKRGYSLSKLADDQIRIGEALTKKSRLIVSSEKESLPALSLDYFGYRLAFVPDSEISGKYGDLAKSGTIRRLWDFDGADADGNLWHGYARRFVNAYVPRFDTTDAAFADKYGKWESEASFDAENPIKTLHHIACEDRVLNDAGKWKSEIALVTLKGDIDNLGAMFQQGLDKHKPTFAKMASLSRQVNAFFALWLPWYCEHGTQNGVSRFRNTYTVFAGGDDFFLIGPWDSTIQLASELRQKFSDYVANPNITFSAGMVMTHPKTPVRHLARKAEEALEHAKAIPEVKPKNIQAKDGISLWGSTVRWADWQTLLSQRLPALEALMARAQQHGADFSTGLTYSLLQLADRSGSDKPEDAIWRSQLHYRLARFFRDKVKGGEETQARREKLLNDAIKEIGGALEAHKKNYRLPVSVLLYRQRE